MKKKLEADLISIAHRVLKLKNKSELIQLHLETQRLYEKLSVLKFLEENFGEIKPTIGQAEIEEKLATAFEGSDDVIFEEEKLNTPQVESIDQKIEMPQAHTSDFDITFEKKPTVEIVPSEKSTTKQISFEELLGHTINEPVFVKAEENVKVLITESETSDEIDLEDDTYIDEEKIVKKTNISTGIPIIAVDLSDKAIFEKELFANSPEDLNRVVSQLNTFDNLQEAQDFIEEIVKPDYNNWEGKEEYEVRFMKMVAKKFV